MTEQEMETLLKKMRGEFASEHSLQEVRGNVQELKTEMKEVRGDLANLEDKVDGMAERLNQLPTKGEFEAMLNKVVDLAVLKAEHDHMKKIIETKLGVEV